MSIFFFKLSEKEVGRREEKKNPDRHYRTPSPVQERETVLLGEGKKKKPDKNTLTCLRPSQLYKTETHKLSMLKSV